jgi:hypothetical protein
MPGTMSREDLALDLKTSLHDAADVFAADGDMERLLAAALLDFGRLRPRTQLGSLTLESGKMAYPAPADCYLFKSSLWGIAPITRSKPWEKQWPGQMPDVDLVDGAAGLELHLTPAPSVQQIAALGNEFRYYYFGTHAIGVQEADTTVRFADRDLLLLRAQAEAASEMVTRNITKPVQMRDGLHSAPKNMTPAAWCETLLSRWEKKMLRLPG